MDVVLATCSSFDYIAEACDIVAESCTCRQTKVVIPASTILRTCASPLSRDLYNQQLIVDSSFSQANRDTRVAVTRVKPPNCGDSVILDFVVLQRDSKSNRAQGRSVTTYGHRLGST